MSADELDSQTVTTFVADTHTLFWYLSHPDRLSIAANAVFRLANTGNAMIIVPAIVVAELYFLYVKLSQPRSPGDILDALAEIGGVYVSDLGRAQLERLDVVTDVPEMHDRLIAAEAMALDAPIVTRDEILRKSLSIRTLW